jgi:hypothetical protein
MYSPIDEAAKRNKCPTKKSITSSPNTPESEEEKEIKNYVEHDIKEYIEKALKEVPSLQERYDIKVKEGKK